MIDEIDLHLHSNLQKEVLPKLIKLFPKIQFIVTTHSPLFLLGMKDEFTDDGFEIRNMPDGNQISVERFKEFEQAYSYFRNTEKYENELKTAISDAKKPIIFVEGDYDRRYLHKAAEFLNKKYILEKVKLLSGDGFKNLDKIWTSLNTKLSKDTKLSEAISQKILLLYDCDTQKEDSKKINVFKRVIPYIEDNPIKKGIENLFEQATIAKAIQYKTAFIDITPEIEKTVRGKKVTEPEKIEVNKDEKGNFCNWLCQDGGSPEDFKNFDRVFKIIEEFIDS